MLLKKIPTAVGMRLELEKQFFPDGMTSADIKLLDAVQKMLTQSFKAGVDIGSGSEMWSNNACLGYAILGAREIALSESTIEELIGAIRSEFDFTSVYEAEKVYENSPY